MKKNYVKPCSSCMLVVAEQAILVVSLRTQNFERAPHVTIGSSTTPAAPGTPGNAKENLSQDDEE